MAEAHPTDEEIRETASILLMDSPRRYYEYVGPFKPGGRERLVVVVDSTNAQSLADWRTRINGLRPDA